MYNTFRSTKPVQQARVDKTSKASKHPGGSAHACTECRRRKSKCDGERPCSKCVQAGQGDRCRYEAPKQRTIPSQRVVDELSNSLDQYRGIVERLLPGRDISQLRTLSRQELVESVNGVSANLLNTSRPAPAIAELEKLHSTSISYYEQAPNEKASNLVTDDVNALSLRVEHQTSFVGSSSIAAALKVITFLAPESLNPARSAFEGSNSVHQLQFPSRTDGSERETPEIELKFIDGYFEHFHPLTPMLDEEQFRKDFTSRRHTEDQPWQALLNMVLATGSICYSNCLDTTHMSYYELATRNFNVDSLGNGRIESIQALALIGGFYLHYTNRPNIAMALLGAALRMSYALGIHRIRQKAPASRDRKKRDSQSELEIRKDLEVKRRTWWCLVCFDIWGSTTLGRPITDHFAAATTTREPTYDEVTNQTVAYRHHFLVASVRFCRIWARILDRLAATPCLSVSETARFDSDLTGWLDYLPAILKPSTRCPQNVAGPRAILYWRFQNARFLLHRPILLAAALLRRPSQDLSEAERKSIDICREVAGETIHDIALGALHDQTCGWNAVWFLFQAAMVPLVSLFYEHDVPECDKWRSQVERVLDLLQSMELMSPIARRSREVVNGLFEASARASGDSVQELESMDLSYQWMFDDIWNTDPCFEWLTPADLGSNTLFSSSVDI